MTEDLALCVLTVCSGKFEYGPDPSDCLNIKRERWLIHGLRKVLINRTWVSLSAGKERKVVLRFFESGRYYFIYRPSSVTKNGSHVRDAVDMKAHYLILLDVYISSDVVWYVQHWSAGEYRIALQWVTLARRTLGVMPLLVVWTKLWRIKHIGHMDFTVQCISCLFILFTFAVGVFWEVLFFSVRKAWNKRRLFLLLPFFCIVFTSNVPLLASCLRISFGVVLAKRSFGGTGQELPLTLH